MEETCIASNISQKWAIFKYFFVNIALLDLQVKKHEQKGKYHV